MSKRFVSALASVSSAVAVFGLSALPTSGEAQVVRADNASFTVVMRTARLIPMESGEMLATAVVTYNDYRRQMSSHSEWRATGCEPRFAGGWYSVADSSQPETMWIKDGPTNADAVVGWICLGAYQNARGR